MKNLLRNSLEILIGAIGTIVLTIAAGFYFTSGLANTADRFFQAVQQKDFTQANRYLAEEFKISTDGKTLEDFLSKNAILDFKEASWSSREIQNDRGELNGSIKTETGGVVPIEILFVKENDGWKILAIQKPIASQRVN